MDQKSQIPSQPPAYGFQQPPPAYDQQFPQQSQSQPYQMAQVPQVVTGEISINQ